MNEQEKARYLANVYLVIAADGNIDHQESRLFELVTRDIHAGVEEQNNAKSLATAKKIQSPVAERWSDRIRNLEDMMLVAYCSGEINPSERQLIVEYARSLEIEQTQLNQINQEAKARHLRRQKAEEENERRLAEATSTVPYGIDKRPMPMGEDFDRLLPERVGEFQRKPLKIPAGDNITQVYASYSATGSATASATVHVEVGFCAEAVAAQQVVHVVQAEAADVTEATLAISTETDPSYVKLKTDNPRIGKRTSLFWTLGRFYFSAASSNEKGLDAFMEVFPY